MVSMIYSVRDFTVDFIAIFLIHFNDGWGCELSDMRSFSQILNCKESKTFFCIPCACQLWNLAKSVMNLAHLVMSLHLMS